MASKAHAVKAATVAAVHAKNPVKSAKAALRAGGDEAISPTIEIPKHGFEPSNEVTKTPKTPADEAIEFFETATIPGEQPIQVYELKLEPDGGPSKEKSVCCTSFSELYRRECSRQFFFLLPQYIRLPPPYNPYVLRISLDAGTPASRNGVFKTNFPIDGGKFDRTRFQERT